MCIPGTQPFGAAMFAAGMKCAVSGFIIGGVIGGIASSIRGNGFMEGAAEGALYGAINGFSAGAIFYCVSQGISAAVGACNRAKAADGVTIRGVKSGELTPEAMQRAQGLPHTADGQTISNLKAGNEIHRGFMQSAERMQVRGGGIHGGTGRVDAFAKNIIYELKPNNTRSIAQGIAQLHRYNNALGGGFKMVLVVY